MSLFFTHLSLAFSSIKQNRSRSFLTSLGIAIGVASLVLILSLTGSVRKIINEQIHDVDTGIIAIKSKSPASDSSVADLFTQKPTPIASTIPLEAYEKIKTLPNLTSAPIFATKHKIVGEKTLDQVSVFGTTSDLSKIRQLSVSEGSFLEDVPEQHIAVLGKHIARELFGNRQVVGKIFKISDQQFIVAGVLNKVKDPINLQNLDFNNAVLINSSNLSLLENNIKISQIDLKTNETDIIHVTLALQRILQDLNQTDYEILTGNQLVQTSNPIFTVVSKMLLLVAGVALTIGGIGVMNIMLVAAAERTREIGIRKAVGATAGNIIMQFLLESIILSSLGGLLGLTLGSGIVLGVALFLHIEPYLTWQIIGITFLVSALVGVIFGIYPAIIAARKNPIDALKYYR